MTSPSLEAGQRTSVRAGSAATVLARGLSDAEARVVQRAVASTLRQYPVLERRRLITTEEAEALAYNARQTGREATELAKRRRVSRKTAGTLRQRGQALLVTAAKTTGLLRHYEQRAARLRRTSGLRTIRDFTITPPVIRVHEGEAALISFTLRKPVRSVHLSIWQRWDSSETRPAGWHFADWSEPPKDRYQDTFWDGTWDGIRNRPPPTGTYLVVLEVTDGQGEEQVSDFIRVENPNNQTVLPRNGSGLDLASLRFNGTTAVLTDTGGHAITMRAVSGIRANHRRAGGRDWTHPRYQWRQNLGPLPEGRYEIAKDNVQQPKFITVRGGREVLGYPSGGTVRTFGPRRAQLRPNLVRGPKGTSRSQFFLHLDKNNDGTAGCIGVDKRDLGKLNQVMSLISRMSNASKTLPVIVQYPRQ
jgi:hypothetical protein